MTFYRYIIVLLTFAVAILIGTTAYYYYQYNKCKDNFVENSSIIYIKTETAKIDSNKVKVFAPAQKILKRTEPIVVGWNINEVALDKSLYRNNWFDFDTTLPEYFTAIHDTVIESKIRIISSRDNGHTYLIDTTISLQNRLNQMYFYPENIFNLQVEQTFDIFNINYLQIEKNIINKEKWYETTEAHYLRTLLVGLATFYVGTKIGDGNND